MGVTDAQLHEIPLVLQQRVGEAEANRAKKMMAQVFNEPQPAVVETVDFNVWPKGNPNDAYAHEHEGGKLGKTEAWLILDCPEGAELVYGIQPGTDLETLEKACEHHFENMFE